MRYRAKGFTLLELLTVIAIILILMGLLIVGTKAIFGGSGKKETEVTLKNLQAMTAELETLGPLKSPTTWDWINPTSGTRVAVNTATTHANWNLDLWKVPFREGASATGDAQPLPTFLVGDNATTRLDSPATINTVLVMSRILSVKNNQDALAKLPTSRLFKVRAAAAGAMPPATNAVTILDGLLTNADRYPILLDNWNNPIIYVPASGLGLSGATAKVAANGSVPNYAIKLSGQSSGDQTRVVVSPDGKGFWASAGPDGNFQTGDDNIYSFEQ